MVYPPHNINTIKTAIAIDITSGEKRVGLSRTGRIAVDRRRRASLHIGDGVNEIDSVDAAVAIDIAGDVIASLGLKRWRSEHRNAEADEKD